VVIAASRGRVLFAGSVVAAIAAAACGTIAELDVKYDDVTASVDGGGGIDPSIAEAGHPIIRDGSFVEPDAGEPPILDPSDAGPCESDSDDGGGCDFLQGLGCCLLPLGSSRCIFQWEIEQKCQNGVFVGCRGDDPNTESACCWRDGPANSKMSLFASSCDGGAHACAPDAGYGCATGTCTERPCSLAVGELSIGTCSSTPVECP
jgi:hypothetical protein